MPIIYESLNGNQGTNTHHRYPHESGGAKPPHGICEGEGTTYEKTVQNPDNKDPRQPILKQDN